MSSEPRDRTGLALVAVLATSLLVRVYLVLSGGLFYWPDERRYEVSRSLVDILREGDIGGALRGIAAAPDHVGYKILGVIPAAIEAALGADLRIPGLFFCGASVASIALTWAIALRAGAGRREALWAAILMAVSVPFLYYARHLLPYDVALASGLFAVWLATGKVDGVRAFAAGAAASATFLTYNGYWTIAGIALLACVAAPPWHWRDLLLRGAGAVLGFGVPIWCIAMACALAGGDFLGSLVSFSATIDQGDFAEGWRVPFAYLGTANPLLLGVWLAALLYAAQLVGRRRGPARAAQALGAVVVIYACLALSSSVFDKFVVYGRLVRQLVPFLCLLAAFGLERLRGVPGWGSRAFAGAMALILVCAGVDFHRPLTQVFPREFEDAVREIGMARPGRYHLVQAVHIYPEAVEEVVTAPHEIVLSAFHPLQYRPYQYEGYGPEQRRTLREVDITMRAVRFDDPPTR